MKAPEFNLADENNIYHKLADYLGKWVVLYFYPKDDTPGCTAEACSFRDNLADLKKYGVEILGVSKDSVKSHKKFSEKYNLNFTILSDESLETIKAYGAYGAKKFMGKTFEGVLRVTFLIDKKGFIKKKYEKVSPKEHAREILDDIRGLEKMLE
jgi:peroxiredoxin Q/BCP